jgi:hypothetical protein
VSEILPYSRINKFQSTLGPKEEKCRFSFFNIFIG